MSKFVLIVEDQDSVRLFLMRKVQKSLGAEVEVSTASSISEAISEIDRIWATRPSQVLVVLDVLVPMNRLGAPELAELIVSKLCSEKEKLPPPFPLILFMSAYETLEEVTEWRAKFTSEPDDPRSYFVSKGSLDWGVLLIGLIRRAVYGFEIETRLDEMWGEPAAQRELMRSRRGRFGEGTHQIQNLTDLILPNFHYLAPSLKDRIEKHFILVRGTDDKLLRVVLR